MDTARPAAFKGLAPGAQSRFDPAVAAAVEFLSPESVDVSRLYVKGPRTGRAFIVVSGGQSVIVVDPSVNSELRLTT